MIRLARRIAPPKPRSDWRSPWRFHVSEHAYRRNARVAVQGDDLGPLQDRMLRGRPRECPAAYWIGNERVASSPDKVREPAQYVWDVFPQPWTAASRPASATTPLVPERFRPARVPNRASPTPDPARRGAAPCAGRSRSPKSNPAENLQQLFLKNPGSAPCQTH